MESGSKPFCLCGVDQELKGHGIGHHRTCPKHPQEESRKLVYVAGSMRNREGILAVSCALRGAGFDIFNDWIMPGEETDTKWQEFEQMQGRTYAEALQSAHADDVVRFDQTWLDRCDALVLVLPAGKSAHIELGYVRGQGKPAFVFMPEEPERWDIMYLLATGIVRNLDELVLRLSERQEAAGWEEIARDARAKWARSPYYEAPRMSASWQTVIGSEKVG